MKPLPVLLLVRKLDHGGCERDLTKVALGLDRSRFEPHVGCFRPEGLRLKELQSGEVPILHIPVMSFRSMGALRGAAVMCRYIRRHGIRLVHSYDVPTALFATPVARTCRVPAVLTSQLSYRTLYSPMEHKLLRGIDRLSHAVVVNCLAMRRHMIEDEGLSPDRIRLCYNGVDSERFHPGESRRPPALDSGAVVIGAVANLRQEKGLDLLLRAFAKLRRKNDQVRCYIVGSGPCEADLHSLAEELGIQNDCVFQPGKSGIYEDLRWIDIFALPSYSEAFSNALLEAMSSGCAVVGSKVGGTPELISSGATGLLFERGSVDDLTAKLETLVAQPELRRKLSEQGRKFAETFSLQRNLECFGSIYESLVQKK